VSSWKKWAARTPNFLWEYVPSTVLFHAQLTTKTSINSSIDHRNHVRWPTNHRTMATGAIQHHCWCLLLPPLLSRPSISPRSRTNSLRGSTKMGHFYVWAYLRHKMCSGVGTNKTIGPVPFLIDLMGDREGRDWRGDVTINCGWRRQRVGDTTIIIWSRGQFEAIDSRSCSQT
jgi:hypothetical protein